ncbi:MAG: helicase associated domain-containing protein [Planctomycetota bacterium]
MTKTNFQSDANTPSKEDEQELRVARKDQDLPSVLGETPKPKDHAHPLFPSSKATRNRRRRISRDEPEHEPPSAQRTWFIPQFEAAWEVRFKELLAFKKRYGHCNVFRHMKKETVLGRWVTVQRRYRKLGRLREDRFRRLDEIGFVWSSQSPWEIHLEDLKAFQNQHDHCNVPDFSKNDPLALLGRWVKIQRYQKKQGILSEDRIRRLEELDFTWGALDVGWEKGFNDLQAFHKQHGHCNASTISKTDAAVGIWVRNQRQKKRLGTLSEGRIRRLGQLGFVWNAKNYDKVWQKHFNDLATFKEKHGHCNVPPLSRPHAFLGRWCATQRTYKSQGRLREDRLRRLEEIGLFERDD